MDMQVTTDDAVAQLSDRGRVEWELALTKAANLKLQTAFNEINKEVRVLKQELEDNAKTDGEDKELSELPTS
jgi:hypothetical protein